MPNLVQPELRECNVHADYVQEWRRIAAVSCSLLALVNRMAILLGLLSRRDERYQMSEGGTECLGIRNLE